MPGRNWRKSVSLHVCPCLHERLLLITWNCTCDPRYVYPKYKVSCCSRVSNVSFRINRMKQTESKRLLSLLWHSRQQCSYLACAIAPLSRAIFRSCWSCCTCVDTRTYLRNRNRKYLWTWTAKIALSITQHFSSSSHNFTLIGQYFHISRMQKNIVLAFL